MTHSDQPVGGGRRKAMFIICSNGEAKRKRKGEEAKEKKTASIAVGRLIKINERNDKGEGGKNIQQKHLTREVIGGKIMTTIGEKRQTVGRKLR